MTDAALLVPGATLRELLESTLAQARPSAGDYALSMEIVPEGLLVTWREIEERPAREMVRLVVARA